MGPIWNKRRNARQLFGDCSNWRHSWPSIYNLTSKSKCSECLKVTCTQWPEPLSERRKQGAWSQTLTPWAGVGWIGQKVKNKKIKANEQAVQINGNVQGGRNSKIPPGHLNLWTQLYMTDYLLYIIFILYFYFRVQWGLMRIKWHNLRKVEKVESSKTFEL